MRGADHVMLESTGLLLCRHDSGAGRLREPREEPGAPLTPPSPERARVRGKVAAELLDKQHRRLSPDRAAVRLRPPAQELVELVGDLAYVQRRHVVAQC